MIPFYAIFARKHGEAVGYPVIAVFDDAGFSAVFEKYNELVGPDGVDFRAAHAEVQFIRNLHIDRHHIFPDPATIENARKASALAEARRVRAANEAARSAVENAKDKADEARSALQDLTPEQVTLLEEADAAEKAHAAAMAEKPTPSADDQAAIDLERERAAKGAEEQKAAAEASAESGTAALTQSIPAIPSPVATDEPAPAATDASPVDTTAQ